jgi:hypothetical protein
MNKSDIKLILIIIFISLSLLLLPKIFNSKKSMKALVYYEDKLIQTIDLSLSETREYVVDGYNGKVVIETEQNKIRVKEEISPLHLCSKQGWVSSPYQVIVCLPNKVVIKLESEEQAIDAIVR